jgi:hypothetical protein
MTPSAMRSNAASAVPDSAPAETFTPAEIQAQLKRVVESPFFRSSKRCRLFLERVVEHSLSQSPEPLKERTLGVHVFAREPTYDTATDPIVRVTAGEVRRRLAQYYAEEAHHPDLRIDLPPGSYAPMYSRPHPVVPPPTPVAPAPPQIAFVRRRHSDRRARWWWAGAIVVAAAAILGAIFMTTRQAAPAQTAFTRFWGPLLDAQVPVLLCPGGLDMYELPAQVKEAANAAARSTGELPLLEISPRQVQRVGARYVAIGDAVAIARIASLFQERRRPYQIREQNATSFADLRASPAVLIGMFSNAWYLQLGSGFRFVPTIEGDGHHVSIVDRQDPERSWRLPRPWPALDISKDYALISRVVDPATGTLVLSVGGITPFGTTAAGEFVTSPEHLERALASVRDWSTRSLQIVLETQVIDGAAGAPRVVATHVW